MSEQARSTSVDLSGVQRVQFTFTMKDGQTQTTDFDLRNPRWFGERFEMLTSHAITRMLDAGFSGQIEDYTWQLFKDEADAT